MQIGQGQGFPVVSNQPMNIDSYEPDIVTCTSDFSGSVLSQTNCTSDAQTLRKGDATYPAPVIAIVLLSIFLVV